MILRLAWRNIFRNKRRTGLTVTMIIFGFALFSFWIALADGAYEEIIQQIKDMGTGEAQIHYGDYLDNPKLYKAIPNIEKTLDELERNDSILALAPRIRGSALLFLSKENHWSEGIGSGF